MYNSNCLKYYYLGRAEKRFLAFPNMDSFWYLSSIFCKQTLLVAVNKFQTTETFREGELEILTLYFGRGAILINRKIPSVMALSYRIIFCREFCTVVAKMKKLRIRRKITGN